MYDLVSDFHMISWMNSAHYQVQPEEEVKNLHSHISHSDTFSKTELQDLTRISPNVGCWVWKWAVLHPPSSSDVILNVMLNLQCVSCCFYSAADSLFQSRGHCVQLTYGYCAFSAMVDSLAEWIELWSANTQKSWGCQTELCVFSLSYAVGSDPEFARYVAGVSQAMQQKRQVQQIRRPSNTRGNWPVSDEQHRTWSHPEYYSEGYVPQSQSTPNISLIHTSLYMA